VIRLNCAACEAPEMCVSFVFCAESLRAADTVDGHLVNSKQVLSARQCQSPASRYSGEIDLL
jgi:hypothetical protein